MSGLEGNSQSGTDDFIHPTKPLAFTVSSNEGGKEIVWPIEKIEIADGYQWLHIPRDDLNSLENTKAFCDDELIVRSLIQEETRPRCTVYENGILLTLRGVNTNPGASPEDMVSIRLWIEPTKILSVWVRPLRAISDTIQSVRNGRAPKTIGDFVVRLCLRLADRAEGIVSDLDDELESLEEKDLIDLSNEEISKLADIRRMSAKLRRFLNPQRDALTALENEQPDWLLDRDTHRLKEAIDRTTRLVETLDSMRERALVVQEELAAIRADAMNKHMLLLADVTAIFLPLGLLTGIFGMNVGGLPFTDSWYGFSLVVVFMLVCAIILWIILKRRGMIGK